METGMAAGTSAVLLPLRMVLYTRVSTEEQATSGLGLEAQEHMLDRAVEYEGWTVVETIRDEGESAKTLDRPGLQRALRMLANGEADGLVVAKLDRLSRSILDFASLLDWLDQLKVRLVALDMRLDTSTSMGRLASSLIVLIAEWERGTTAERTRAALAALRAQGKPIGRPAVADIPELADRIHEMHHEQHMTLQSIADQLNREGVPTIRGAPRWAKSSIQAAAGYRRPKPRRKPADLPVAARR